MSENETNAAQDAGLSNPNIQQTQNSPTSQVDLDAIAEKLLAKLKPVISEEIQSTRQSTKDRRIHDLEQGQQSILTQIEEWNKEGMTFRQMKDKLDIQELQAIVRERVTQPKTDNQRNVNTESRQILQIADIKENDPDVLALDRLNAPLSEYADLVKRRITPKPEPNAASITQTAQNQNITTDLQAEYQKKLLERRGNFDAILDLQKEYREKGLKI
jgi:hypothetical protein